MPRKPGRPHGTTKREHAEAAARSLLAGDFNAHGEDAFAVAVREYGRQHFGTDKLTARQVSRFGDYVEEALYWMPTGEGLAEKFGPDNKRAALLSRRTRKQAGDDRAQLRRLASADDAPLGAAMVKRALIRAGAYESGGRWIFPHSD